ncbi:MAG: HesA/MoeB/ThiF family protein [Treponema sp.]|nr:HesA/MoeB/ThiF family protein [Treponema sp.]
MNNATPERYIKNSGALTPEDLAVLAEKRVFIAGCGGLGAYILEMLARLGVLTISVADGDVFSRSNLNRQLLCTEQNIGAYKTDAAVQRIKEINSDVKINAHPVFITKENARSLLQGHDVILDALDNIQARLLLEQEAEALNIPLVHGAIQNLFAQVAVILPGDRTLHKLYGEHILGSPSVPSFTPALCAAFQVSETVKLLCGKKTIARNSVLMIDLYDNSITTITM